MSMRDWRLEKGDNNYGDGQERKEFGRPTV